MDFIWTSFMPALGWIIGGTVGGATGIGAIMVAMPLLTTVLSPGDAVLVSCVVGLYGSIHLSFSYRKSCSWKDIRDLAIGSVPGCLLGVFVLQAASIQVLQLMVCFMLTCFVLMQLFRRAAAFILPESAAIGIGAGVICGFVSASVAMMGAPLGIYVLMKHWSPDRARGNMSVFYAFTSIGTVVLQAVSGLYSPSLLKIALIGMAGCAAGQIIGVRLGRHIDQQLFHRLVLIFLAVSAVILFFRAVG